MTEVSVYEAKTHLSRLLRRVAAGEEVVIARAGEPIAKLVPVKRVRAREFGLDEGAVEVPAGFDDPLPDDVLDGFEG